MDRNLLEQTAARIAEIASDCFDRPTTERLRQLGQELEKRLQSDGYPGSPVRNSDAKAAEH